MEHPWGIPELTSEYQLLKLETANTIYKLVARGISLCIALHIIVSVEKPSRSYFLGSAMHQSLQESSLAGMDLV
jgi:hypothetical protein